MQLLHIYMVMSFFFLYLPIRNAILIMRRNNNADNYEYIHAHMMWLTHFTKIKNSNRKIWIFIHFFPILSWFPKQFSPFSRPFFRAPFLFISLSAIRPLIRYSIILNGANMSFEIGRWFHCCHRWTIMSQPFTICGLIGCQKWTFHTTTK